MSEKGNILILGLGSEILRDDGIGPRLARDLRAHFTSNYFQFNTSTVGGLEIIDLLKGYKVAFIIDGMKSKDIEPGEVFFMDKDQYRETLHLSNIHDASFETTLKLGSKIGADMPQMIFVIGVGVEKDTEFGESFTEKLQEEYVNILKKLHQFILEKYKLFTMMASVDPIKGGET